MSMGKSQRVPHGMEPYDDAGPDDLGALSEDQQNKLNTFKMTTRLENEQYLRQHPEVEALLSGFLSDVLTKRPDGVRDFAADYFTSTELPMTLEKELEDRHELIRQNKVLKKNVKL